MIHERLNALRDNLSVGRSASQIALDAVRTQINDHKAQIDQLITLLARSSENESLYQHISDSVEKLDGQIKALQVEETRLLQEVSLK